MPEMDKVCEVSPRCLIIELTLHPLKNPNYTHESLLLQLRVPIHSCNGRDFINGNSNHHF